MEYEEQTEISADDFLNFMDVNEHAHLFEMEGGDEIITSSIAPPVCSFDCITDCTLSQFNATMDMQMGIDMSMNMSGNDPGDLDVDDHSDIESLSSVGDDEFPGKQIRMEISPGLLQIVSQDNPSPAPPTTRNEPFNAQKRLEELRKLPIVERQRAAKKRHRENQHQALLNRQVESKEKEVPLNALTSSPSSSTSISTPKGPADGYADENDNSGIHNINSHTEADAALIAKATAENLKALGIDPDSKEGKRQRRKIRNRMSAQLHRERKKEYIDTLEGQVKDRDAIIHQLQTQVNLLVAENEMFRKQLKLSPGDFKFDTIQSTSSSSSSSVSSSSSTTGTSSASDNSDTDDVSVSANEMDGESSPSAGPNFSTIFSVFIMFGMTFWNAPIPMDSKGGQPTALTTMDTMPISFTQLSLPSPQGNEGAIETQMSIIHKRRLSVSSANDDVYDIEKVLKGDTKTFKTGSFVQVPTIAQNYVDEDALWSYDYDDRVAQLYPLEIARRPTLQTGEPNLETSEKSANGHLRRRVFGGNYSTNDATSTGNKYGKDGRKVNRYASSSAAAPEATALSRIIVTQGKALLDPSMAMNQNQRVSVSNTDDNSKSIVPVNQYNGAFSTYVLNHIIGSDENVDPKTRQVALKATEDQNNVEQMLVMLLPASIIQWGTRWSNDMGNGDKNSFKTFMKTHNINGSSTEKYESEDDGGNEISDYFIEIGCSVFKAQLVKNVTIM